MRSASGSIYINEKLRIKNEELRMKNEVLRMKNEKFFAKIRKKIPIFARF
jgi:hypothetical protein